MIKLYRHPKLYKDNPDQWLQDICWIVVFGEELGSGGSHLFCRVFNRELEDKTQLLSTLNGLAPFKREHLLHGTERVTGELRKKIIAKLLVGSL